MTNSMYGYGTSTNVQGGYWYPDYGGNTNPWNIPEFDSYDQMALMYKTWKQGKTKPEKDAYKAQMEYLRRQEERYKQMVGEYQEKYDAAKAANEQRYQDILSGYGQTYGNVQSGYADAISQMQGMGQAELADLRHQFDVSGKNQMASLASSGLLNTTVAPTVQRQNTVAQMRAEALLQERLRREQVNLKLAQTGALTNLDLQKYAFMERREDEYPDFNQMLMLARGLGNI